MATQPPRTLVLHIGDHKTGTTTIQNAFANDHVTLTDRKVFYPGQRAHNYLSGVLKDLSLPEAQTRLKKLATRFDNSDADIFLLSAEALETKDPHRVAEMIQTHLRPHVDHIKVAAYVRPHAERLLSSFAEQTKIGLFSGTLEDFHQDTQDKAQLVYHPRFAAWADVFGQDFHLRPMLRSQLENGSVLDDFIVHILGTTAKQLQPPPAANSSLSLQDLMRLKRIHQHLEALSSKARHSIGWEIMRLANKTPEARAEKLRLHRSLAETIRATYQKDAEAMDASFFGGTPTLRPALDQAVQTAAEAPQSLSPEDHLSESECRSIDVMAQFIATLASQNEDTWRSALRQARITDLSQS